MSDRDPTRWSPFHDRRGVPVCAGDLLKTPHFTDRRGKKHYLYHVAVCEGGIWMMVPTCWLDPANIKGGGKCRICQEYLDDGLVIHGFGPGDYLSFEDRPRGPAHPRDSSLR